MFPKRIRNINKVQSLHPPQIEKQNGQTFTQNTTILEKTIHNIKWAFIPARI